MTASSGKQIPPTAPEALRLDAVREASPSGAEAKRAYHKPALKRLGLLRSVTGSDLKW